MKILYEDIYGTLLFQSGTNPFIAQIGDTVIIQDDEWYVKARTYYADNDSIVITLTQTVNKPRQPELTESSRLAGINRAIVGLNKRQDSLEKTGRILKDGAITDRANMDRQATKERRET